MPTDWRQSNWGNEIALEYGKGIRNYSDSSGDFRVFGSNGPIGWTSEYLTHGPGIILGRKGATRGVRYSTEPFYVIDTAYYVVPKTALDMRWLYYAIIHHKLGDIDDGSPIPSTTRSAVYVRDLEVPSLIEQRAVASILAALDDKIELNRRISKTLESMARAIFKDWFVDFGPTRAKVEGRLPYLSTELWALFPDQFDEAAKPNGWRQTHLNELALGRSQTVNPADVSPETPYIGLEHIPRRSIALDTWQGAGKVTSGKVRFQTGEFLFGKLRPYFHKVGIAPTDGIASTDIVICSQKVKVARSFVICTLFSDAFVAYTDQTSTGTKMPRTSWPTMAKYEISIPQTNVVLQAFDELVWPFFSRILANVHENRTLAQTRDLLLPKLISGEICLREAEKVVEKAL